MMQGVDAPSLTFPITHNPTRNSQNHQHQQSSFHQTTLSQDRHSPFLVSLWNSSPLMKFQWTCLKQTKWQFPPSANLAENAWKRRGPALHYFQHFSIIYSINNILLDFNCESNCNSSSQNPQLCQPKNLPPFAYLA